MSPTTINSLVVDTSNIPKNLENYVSLMGETHDGKKIYCVNTDDTPPNTTPEEISVKQVRCSKGGKKRKTKRKRNKKRKTNKKRKRN